VSSSSEFSQNVEAIRHGIITELGQLPAMWDTSSDRNKQEQTYVWETVQEFIADSCVSFYKFFCATMQACELPPLYPLHLLTMVGRVAANGSEARGNSCGPQRCRGVAEYRAW
jgi:hypothetical protein